MELLKVILISFGILGLSSSSLIAQIEYFNLIENELIYNPDFLADDWILDDIIDSEILSKTYSVTEHFKFRSMASSNYKFGDKEFKNRIRVSARNRRIKLSFLVQKNHQTAGVEMDPVPGKLKLLFGDFGLSHGLGLVFSSKRRFNSWLQDPHQQLYRASGFSVNSSSDSSRFLRGGGIFYSFQKLNLQAFFSENADGIFLNYKSAKLHLGLGLSNFGHLGQNYIRFGPFMKCRIGGGILFGELAIQNNNGQALELGYSFFGDERQSFIIKYSYYSSGFIPHNSILNFTKEATSDLRKIDFNYKWEWRRNWILYSNIQTESSLMLSDRGLFPDDDWIFKLGIIRLLENDGQIISRLVGDEAGIRAMVKWRIGLTKKGDFMQFESGWSRKNARDLDNPQNLYFAFDICQKSIIKRLAVNAGISIHQSSEKSVPLYRYEPDLFYSMSIPALTGSGIRGYVKLKCRLSEDLQFEIKYNKSLSYIFTGEIITNLIKFQAIYSPELRVGSSVVHQGVN